MEIRMSEDAQGPMERLIEETDESRTEAHHHGRHGAGCSASFPQESQKDRRSHRNREVGGNILQVVPNGD